MLRNLIKSLSNVRGSSARTLYTAEALGVDKYLYSKDKVSAQFVNSADKFKNKMLEYLSPEHMIFTEDLKNMVHLVADAEDIDLVEKMTKKFHSQNKELRFGNYVFGPVFMRMFYTLKNDEVALRMFLDKELDGFFDQISSYQLLLDLLYEKGRYSDIRRVYDVIKDRQLEGGRYPKHCIVIVLGGCYKENTADSFEYSKTLWKELSEAGHSPMRKAATFAAGLALNQKAPHVALEIISSVAQQNYVTVRNIKIQAMLDLQRYEDALPLLRSILEVAPSGPNKQQTIAKDILENVQAAFANSGNKDLQSDFVRINEYLRSHNHVSENTLDEMLSKGVESWQSHQDTSSSGGTGFNNRGSGFNNRSKPFNNNQNRGGYANNNRLNNAARPGLRDLY